MAVAALPKLNFSRGDDASAPKLLTGSRMRKASILKVSAQRITAIRRASAMLLSGHVFGAPAQPQLPGQVDEAHLAALRRLCGASIESANSDDESDSASAVGAPDAAPALSSSATAVIDSARRPF